MSQELSATRGKYSSKITGRCYCGEVTFEYAAEGEIFMGHCHCESCRRATSSPFTSFIGVQDGHWSWTGVLPRTHQTDKAVTRSFCGNCGSPMAYQASWQPGETHFYAASLDDPQHFSAEANYHADEMLPWALHVETLPQE